MVYKLYKREILTKIVNFITSKEIIVLHGARQVGKSTILKILIEDYIKTNYFYMDLENREFLELCEKGAETTFNYLIQKGLDRKKKMYLLIDEIQYLSDPSNFLKLFHDHFSEVKLIVSGSSSFDIKKKFKNSLVGRTINFEIYPLNFSEFLLFKEKEYKLSEENIELINKELIPFYEEYIRFGGYPQIVLESSEEKKKEYLNQIISTYIKKDIRDLAEIRDIDSFNKLVEVLASQSGNLLDLNELSRTLSISRKTLSEYIFLLESTYILKLIRPFYKNTRSELIKTPKIFFIDTGLMHILSLREFPKNIQGNSFETSLFSELLKIQKKVNFWRTTNKQEIDFIIQNKQELFAIEAKLNFQSSLTSALSFFKEKYSSKNFLTSIYGEKEDSEALMKKYPWEIVRLIGGFYF
ncbi:MAG: ATP-binding protein [Candidatus Absconditabacterales bacterium]|nr:ATP-binding protein [Candidatus Absconditabacterales bacterium]